MDSFIKNGVIFHKAVFIDPADQTDFLAINLNTGAYSKKIEYLLDPERTLKCRSGDKFKCIEDLITFKRDMFEAGFGKGINYEVLGFNIYDLFTVMLSDHQNGKTGIPIVIMLDFFLKHFDIGPYIEYEPKDIIDLQFENIV